MKDARPTPPKRSRRWAWVVLGVLVGAAIALAMFLASLLWVWFAYESEPTLLVEYPLKMTGPNSALKDRSKPAHERVARKKRFRWGPGERFRVGEELCRPCLQCEHDSHYAMVAIQDPATSAMIAFPCSCKRCQR